MSYEAVQRRQDAVKAGSVSSVGLPALQHQRVEGRGAAVWGRETVLVCNCLHYLEKRKVRGERRGEGRGRGR